MRRHYFSVIRSQASDYPDERYLFVFKDESKREVVYFLDAKLNKRDLMKMMVKVVLLRTPFNFEPENWVDCGDLGWAQDTWDSMTYGGRMSGIVIFDETTLKSEMQATADRKEIISISRFSHLYPAPSVNTSSKKRPAAA